MPETSYVASGAYGPAVEGYKYLRPRLSSGIYYIRRKRNDRWETTSLGTKELAEAIELYELRLGRPVANNRQIRCAAAFETYISHASLAPSTIALYRGLWELWAVDILGTLRVADVTVDHVAAVLERASRSKSPKTGKLLSPPRIRNLYVALSAFFTSCCEGTTRYRDDNPCNRLGKQLTPTMPTSTAIPEHVVVDEGKIDAIAANLGTPKSNRGVVQRPQIVNAKILKTLVQVMPEIGCRISEICGLHIHDIKPARPYGVVHITQQVAFDRKIKDPSTWLSNTKGTKGVIGSKVRVVPLSEFASVTLNAYIAEGRREGWLPLGDGLLFPSTKGTPRSVTNVTSLIGDAAEEIDGVRVTSHYFRHTFASNQLAAGASLEEIAALIGDKPDTVRTRYAHLQDNEVWNERVAARGRRVS